MFLILYFEIRHCFRLRLGASADKSYFGFEDSDLGQYTDNVPFMNAVIESSGQDKALELTGPAAGEVIEAALQAGADARFKVTGSSMIPTIYPGEVVTIRPVDPADVRQGDIVFYRRENESGHILHRVLWKRRSSNGWVFRTKGDGVWSLDPPVTGAGIMGRTLGGASRLRAWREVVCVCGYAFRNRMIH
jgi:signal peptidase I